MFFLLSRHEIDDIQWNEVITSSLMGYCYAETWYLDIVSPHWKGIVFIQDASYQAVMPLPIQTSYGIEYIKQPLFCQQLGVFARPHLKIPYDILFSFLTQHYTYIADYMFSIHTLQALQGSAIIFTINRFRCIK